MLRTLYAEGVKPLLLITVGATYGENKHNAQP